MASPAHLEDTTLNALRETVRGPVVQPDEPGYGEARSPWNGLLQRRPAAIVRPAGAADVVAAVDFARSHDILIAIRGGGHDYAGTSAGDGCLVIDLSLMESVRVDPSARTARVQGGATWGALDHDAQAFGLATTGASVSTVGVAGATLGGGTGHLIRRHGLSLDNLRAADIVTAAGDLVHASDSDNPDLFWAIRGGGGNFGIATSLEFDLHEVGPNVLAGQIFHRLENAGEVLRHYREFMAGAPDDVQCYAFFIKVPPLELFPQELHGTTALDLVVAHTGSISDGEDLLRPIRDFGDPFFDGVTPQRYTALQQTFDAGMPKGQRWYSRAHYLNEISDAAIDTVLEHAAAMPGAFTAAYFEPMGGAVNRVHPAATAFPHRAAACSFHIVPGWTDPADDDRIMGWCRAFHSAMTPHASGGVYVNLLGHDEQDRVKAAYGPNYQRLVELKNRWDPGNLFSMNQNIRPMA